MTFTRHVDQLPPAAVLQEIDKQVDIDHMEKVLMEEGLSKFAEPFKKLLKLIASKRAALKNKWSWISVGRIFNPSNPGRIHMDGLKTRLTDQRLCAEYF